MKRLLALFLLLAGSTYGQGGPLTPASSSTGSIFGNSASCYASVCVLIHMAQSNVGYSVAVSGTWTGTLAIEQSGDNQVSWAAVTTTTINTLYTSALTPGITDVRVRGSAAMTGSAVVTITASGPATLNQITQTGGSAGGGITLPATNLVSQLPLTEGTGNPVDSKAGTWTFASGNAAPSWNVPISSDPFIGTAAGIPLSVFWTAVPSEGQIKLAATNAFVNTVGGDNFAVAFFNGATFSNDQYAQSTQTASPTGLSTLGVATRISPIGANTYYGCMGDSTTMYLFKVVAGTRTDLSTTPRVTNTGDITRLSVTGSAQTCTITTSAGAVTTLTGADAVITSGLPGLVGRGPVFAGNANNWFAGNATAPAGGGLWFSGGQFATAPSSLNTIREWDIYACYQRASNGNLYNALIQGNGNGAASNANGLVLTGQVNLNNGPIVQQLPHISVLGGSAFGMTPYSNFNGCGVATLTLGTSADRTFDGSFINGLESIYTNNSKTQSGGLQTVGAYQLGGAAAGSGFSSASFLTGKIYYVAGYSSVLDPATRAQVVQALTQSVVNRGGPAPFLADAARGDTCITAGDSITNGFGLASGQTWSQNLSFNTPANMTPFNGNNLGCWNQGVTATTMKELDSKALIGEMPLMSPAARNVIVEWAGTNDMFSPSASTPISYNGTAGQVIQSMKHYADQFRVPGGLNAKIIPVSILSRTSGDTNKDNFNPLLRQYWATFADGFVDLAEVPSLGADAASASSTFFQDGVHPSATSQLNIIAPLIERSVNMIYGNNDFSSATTYVAAAAAAVATTAGTEATNTVTITTAATPANCQVGNLAVIAGVTPAGYNTTTANGFGLGAALILTRTATQITYFNSTTGLGAVSVQGTLVCPQQQDQDVYTELNFGAGNFTLQTCAGLTGQRIYIQNINAVSSTLVPFGTETITGGGATPTVLTNGTTAILESELVSNTAGGCNWRRVQ